MFFQFSSFVTSILTKPRQRTIVQINQHIDERPLKKQLFGQLIFTVKHTKDRHVGQAQFVYALKN